MEDPLKVYHDILSISNEEGGNPNHDPENGQFTSGGGGGDGDTQKSIYDDIDKGLDLPDLNHNNKGWNIDKDKNDSDATKVEQKIKDFISSENPTLTQSYGNYNTIQWELTDRIDSHDVTASIGLKPIIQGKYSWDKILVGYHMTLPEEIQQEDITQMIPEETKVRHTSWNMRPSNSYSYILLSAKNMHLIESLAEHITPILERAVLNKASKNNIQRDQEEYKKARMEVIKTTHSELISDLKDVGFTVNPDKDSGGSYDYKDDTMYVSPDDSGIFSRNGGIWVKTNGSTSKGQNEEITYSIGEDETNHSINDLNQDELTSILTVLKQNRDRRKTK
jgi:adenosyl cobinamide kinase/adenosyl cobinamide phosphate guanylyltransferase